MNRKEEWEKEHQPFELAFHNRRNFRHDNEAWDSHWSKVFGKIAGMTPDSMNGKLAVDIGCGSRPALAWFTDQTGTWNIDPLLNDYKDIPDMKKYWMSKDSSRLISLPAEVLIDVLVGRMDFILCWNVLDHCYNPESVIKNIIAYAKPGAMAIISYDVKRPAPGHPGIDDPQKILDQIENSFQIVSKSDNTMNRNLVMVLSKKR